MPNHQPPTPISLEVKISQETYDSLSIYIETIATSRGNNICDPASLQDAIIEQALKVFLRANSNPGSATHAPK
jgi:hypothetical protein